ncbi:hypothetical protein BCR44DRAFT_1011757 [Catenaria anguillulae PL171]|uniref:F-box domain-containing protein n=1 Tax=Catenaria anguillulae PL171 TaxID=765915 RepID=A0A1Y2I4K2_9FUNG|nr:hypothetical protein BCR44DRAFT_1011757 [Catenaria anguillulae PL171]
MDSLPVIQSAVDRLSDEIWLLVLSQVAVDSLPSLAACMSVSRAWHRLCTDNHVWRAAFLGLNRQLGLDDRLAPPSLHDWSATSWYNLVKDQVAFCRTWAPNKWVTDDHITIPEDGKRPIQELASFSLTLIDLIGPHPEQSVVNIRKAAVDSFHDQANDHTSSPRKGILAVLADHSAPANDPQHLQQRPSVLNQSRVLHFLNLETLEPFSRLLIPEMPNVPLVPGFVPAHWVQLGHVDATRRQFTLFLRVGSHKTSLRLYSIDQAVSYGIESVLDLQVLASHEFPGHVWFGDQPLHPHPTEPNRLMLMFTNLYTDLVTVHHLDATTFELVKVIEIHAPMGSRHYDADFGTLIITTCEYGAVRIWSADTGECLYAFQVAHLAAVDFAIWRPWVRPGLELEPSSKADGAIQNVDKPTAYMDPKWLQVLSVTMPLAEFGLGAPMGLALHSVRSASALVPAVFVNESTDPDPDSKTDVPGIVWRGKAVNPPPPPTPENPEPVVFPEDIEVAPLSANAATVLRYQARHSRLMAFLAGYQLLFTVDLDGVLNVTNMATGKDWGPLVSATQSASEAAQSRPSRLQDVYHGDSIMSRTLTLNAFEFLTPLRPQSPPVATAQTPRSTSTDPSADPHLPPLSAAITAPDLLDALLNHPLPEQAASTLGAAALLGTVPMAVIQSVLHQLPDSGMEQDRIDAIFNGMQAGGISTLAQMGEPPALPPPTSQSAEPLNTQPAHPEYVADLPPLPTCILSMAEELRKAARLATDIAPTLTEPASVAMEAADRASSAMSHLESHPPVTADGAQIRKH